MLFAFILARKPIHVCKQLNVYKQIREVGRTPPLFVVASLCLRFSPSISAAQLRKRHVHGVVDVEQISLVDWRRLRVDSRPIRVRRDVPI
jgi:hypothetical protein